jgi:hypothetical protein
MAGYGYGHWPRRQVVAIVAEYWRKGATVGEVASRLDLSEAFVGGCYRHFGWMRDLRETREAPAHAERV